MPRLPVLCLAALLLSATMATPANEPVAPRALAARIAAGGERPQVLDVRTPEEYAAGHVPGAVLIPHGQVAARVGELDRTRPVIVYCRSGRRSALAEDALRKAGFEVAQLQGSWQAWEAEGLPAECAGKPCTPLAEPAR